MGLHTRRGAARAGSNLGHFPEQFEPNSTTLYIIQQPAHLAGLADARILHTRLPHTHLTSLHLSPSPWNLAALKIRRVVWRGAARGTQSAGRTCANKIDFLSARWRFVTSLFTSVREVWTLDLWRTTVTYHHSYSFQLENYKTHYNFVK